jgi:hypothetical protein
MHPVQLNEISLQGVLIALACMLAFLMIGYIAGHFESRWIIPKKARTLLKHGLRPSIVYRVIGVMDKGCEGDTLVLVKEEGQRSIRALRFSPSVDPPPDRFVIINGKILSLKEGDSKATPRALFSSYGYPLPCLSRKKPRLLLRCPA